MWDIDQLKPLSATMVLIDSELSPIYGIIRENDTKRVTKEPFETGKAKEVGWQFFLGSMPPLMPALCGLNVLVLYSATKDFFSGTSGFDYFK